MSIFLEIRSEKSHYPKGHSAVRNTQTDIVIYTYANKHPYPMHYFYYCYSTTICVKWLVIFVFIILCSVFCFLRSEILRWHCGALVCWGIYLANCCCSVSYFWSAGQSARMHFMVRGVLHAKHLGLSDFLGMYWWVVMVCPTPERDQICSLFLFMCYAVLTGRLFRCIVHYA